MSFEIPRRQYADLYGPTAGDRIRLADTDLFLEIEQDLTVYGEEVVFGGGKVIRDGMGQNGQATRDEDIPDTVITNAVILDYTGIYKADIAVKDGHIFRIGNRTGIAPGKNPLEVEASLEKVVPDAYKLHAHHWLILHGRYICVARKPICGRCLINELCQWPEKTPPEFSLDERIATSASMMGKGLKEF